jgi:hypothetical protein
MSPGTASSGVGRRSRSERWRKKTALAFFAVACGSIPTIRHHKCTIESSSSARPASNLAQAIYE